MENIISIAIGIFACVVALVTWVRLNGIELKLRKITLNIAKCNEDIAAVKKENK